MAIAQTSVMLFCQQVSWNLLLFKKGNSKELLGK